MRINYRLFAAATAIGAVGFLPVAPSAQAYPFDSGCDKPIFNGEFRARGHNWTVSFNSTGEYASGPANVRFDDGGQVSGHVASGRVVGNTINFDIVWHDKPHNSWYFTGTVRDGHAEGMTRNSHWFSQTPLGCATPPPPAGPPPNLR